MSSSTKRALRVLEIVGRSKHPLGVTEIARSLSLPAGTVFRSLDALTRTGLVARYQASSRYVLGDAAEGLRRSLIARFEMRELCLPYLRQLASVSGETVSLHVRLGWYGLRIACVPGTAEVTNAPPLGEAHPLAETYAGRAMLAFFPKDDIGRYRDWAEKAGVEPPPPSRLRLVRDRGFDLSKADFGGGRMAIAFPVMQRDMAAASVALEGPAVSHPLDAEGKPLREWRDIIGEIESLTRLKPWLFRSPFGHLDPDTIAL